MQSFLLPPVLNFSLISPDIQSRIHQSLSLQKNIGTELLPVDVWMEMFLIGLLVHAYLDGAHPSS